ncbi:hypothetical protein EV421DRAFT_1860863 [Armillaria borealis]|uniref:Uncharacterized protein n=1 Tax=Armillaria borealis TaxID=47425 RepID=A0AA39IUF8_9AGAR|nr:hypothetical protein EV421DRAFT_1860863 [Armillaria borealis]
MLSLLRVASLAGILSVLVQGAVVLDGRQLGEPGPVVHPNACTDLPTVASATDSIPLPTFGAGAEPAGTIGSPRVGHPQVTKRDKSFSLPLFRPVSSAATEGSRGVGGSCATVDVDSTGDTGGTLTRGASATLVQPASATPAASTAPTVNNHAVRG